MSKLIFTAIGVFAVLGLIWALLFSYSQSLNHYKDISRFTNSFEWIAHRGGSLEAPENTLTAFDYANSLHEKFAFEFDVHFSKDKKVVIIHDETVDRTTNGVGKVRDLTYDELSKLDAGYHFKTNIQNAGVEYPYRNKGVKIPLLEEVFQKYPKTKMIIEIKPSSHELAEAVFNLVKKYDRFDKTVIGSRHIRNTAYARTLDSKILTAASVDEIYRTLMLQNMALGGLDKMHSDVLAIPEKSDNIRVLSEPLLKEVHKRGKKVFIWTVNDKKDFDRLYKLGVDGILTDRPKLLLEFLKEQNVKL